MIWWCQHCGVEDTVLRDRCTSCGSAMQTANLEWLNEGDEGEETVFELELEPLERAALVSNLINAKIRHRWDEDNELVVADARADEVDGLLDEILGVDTRSEDAEDDETTDEYVDEFDDFDDEPSQGASGYDTISQLFEATDRLRTRQEEDDVHRFMEISGEVLMSPPPFGVDEETWADVQSASRNIAMLLSRDEEDPTLDGEIVALRNQLQVLV